MSEQKRFWVGAVLLIAIGVVVVGYDDWKTRRLMRQTASLIAKGDYEGALLMARSAYARTSGGEEARQLLEEAYRARKDPRLLDLLTGSERRLQQTLEAIDLGLLPEARRSFMKLVPGHSVDSLSYHELGFLLFQDDPARSLEHALGIADLKPHDGEGLLRLAEATMNVGATFPERHVANLVKLACDRRDPLSADATAVALTMSLTTSRSVPWPLSALELTGRLQLCVEASSSLRSSFLRALEACYGRRPALERALLSSFKTLCERLERSSDTRQLVECLTRLGKREFLIDWFERSPKAFPPVASGQPENAFVRLLVADMAAMELRWDLVAQIVEESRDDWADFRFLRHFYEGRLIRERPEGNQELVERERQILADGKVKEAEDLATLPWQQAVLAELSRKYL